jgi:hypothetical protein
MKSIANKNNMLVYSSDWHKEESFRMMPVTDDCPFNEVIYDPSTKVLAIVSKNSKEKPHMLPRLDDKGKLVPVKPKSAEEAKRPQFAETRIVMDTYYEYYIDKKEDIVAFIHMFAVNPTHAALEILNKVETVEEDEK